MLYSLYESYTDKKKEEGERVSISIYCFLENRTKAQSHFRIHIRIHISTRLPPPIIDSPTTETIDGVSDSVCLASTAEEAKPTT